MNPTRSERPPSDCAIETMLVGLLAVIGAIFLADRINLSPSQHIALFVIGPATAMMLFEALVLRTYRRPAAGLRLSPTSADLGRVAAKCAAHVVAWAIIALCYWALPLFPFEKYQYYFSFMTHILPVVFAILPVYVYIVDRHQQQPDDASAHFGGLILGRRAVADRGMAADFLVSYLLRAFFLPPILNGVAASYEYGVLIKLPSTTINLHVLYYYFMDKIHIIDVVFSSVGYLFCFRPLDTHVRAPYRRLSSYVVTIFCYAPFNFHPLTGFNFGETNKFWDSLIPVDTAIGKLWMLLIALCVAMNIFANISFGLRFSNVTFRGINTSGPYVYFKHPAYLFKNIAWWLSYVPFANVNGWPETMRSCLLMAVISTVYYYRAKCEEQELSVLPEYRAYLAYIEQFGAIARSRRALRFMCNALRSAIYRP